METNNVILNLIEQVKKLTQENAYLRELAKENEDLKIELQASKDIACEMVGIVNDLKQKRIKDIEEKKWLFNRIEQLKRRVCDKDCVNCVIVRICENNELGLGVKLCCPQLKTIISSHAGSNIEPEHFKCDKFINILEKCGIVGKYDIYEYPPPMPNRENEMVKAFNRLMTMDPNLRVVIIGGVISKAEQKGHAELCYLNSRTQDGKVTIHDPQSETSEEVGKQGFINRVKNDEGVIFYTVNFETLQQIINDHLHILH